jgi:hypothetical protein
VALILALAITYIGSGAAIEVPALDDPALVTSAAGNYFVRVTTAPGGLGFPRLARGGCVLVAKRLSLSVSKFQTLPTWANCSSHVAISRDRSRLYSFLTTS